MATMGKNHSVGLIKFRSWLPMLIADSWGAAALKVKPGPPRLNPRSLSGRFPENKKGPKRKRFP